MFTVVMPSSFVCAFLMVVHVCMLVNLAGCLAHSAHIHNVRNAKVCVSCILAGIVICMCVHSHILSVQSCIGDQCGMTCSLYSIESTKTRGVKCIPQKQIWMCICCTVSLKPLVAT